MMVRNHNNCKDGIRLNPKYCNNGSLVAKLRNEKVKRLSLKCEYTTSVVEVGWVLTRNGEDVK